MFVSTWPHTPAFANDIIDTCTIFVLALIALIFLEFNWHCNGCNDIKKKFTCNHESLECLSGLNDKQLNVHYFLKF